MMWLGLMDAGLYLSVGALLGTIYFGILLRTVRLHAAQAALNRTLPLYLLRLVIAILGFWLVAQQGALPLVLVLLGFLIARILIQRRTGFS